jgi:outer membrane protein OmpA-like peptidoglycan-associated protein
MKNLFKNRTHSIVFFISFCLLGWIQIDCHGEDEVFEFSSEELKEFDMFIRKNAPKEKAFVVVQWVAANFIRTKQWEKAVSVFEKYRPLFDRPMFNDMYDKFKKIIRTLKAPEEKLIVTNLGTGINSDYFEYHPIPTADGIKIYFIGNDRTGGYGGEDVFVSEFIDGVWNEASNLGRCINTDINEGIVGVSADGNTLLLFGNYDSSLGEGDIYYTDKTINGWNGLHHFPRPVNSKYWECDASITCDGKAVLYTSDRPGGVGGFHKKDSEFNLHCRGNTDIYISLKCDKGWSEPINLGAIVNTPYCERTPFLHPDGKTLYFSSDGHYGLGALDVYKTVRLNDTSWTEWSEPVNLGKEINTVGSDWGYKVSTCGNVAYFSACDENEAYDIYSINLPKETRPELVATICGKITNSNGHPLDADIKWEDLSTGENAGQLKSNPQDGTYFIALPLGKNYGYYAQSEGYYPLSHNINLLDTTGAVNITENIILVSIEEMKEKEIAVRINNIFFDYNEYEIKPESFPELDRLANILNQNQDAKIEIAGHTDDIGSDSYNLELSGKRAQAVVNHLISLGCCSENLIARGYGESKPLVSNETEEGCTQNRRVEFRFIK